jgi:hypothetical protein
MLTPEILFPVSNSRLTAFKRSPKHLIQYLTDKKPATPAMEFGKAFHMALLEPELFSDSYICAPEVDRRTKEGKELYLKFVANQPANINIINSDDERKLAQMIESIMTNPIASELLAECDKRETSVLWDNLDFMIPMKGIIDAHCTDYIIDIKTCADAQPDKFQRDAYFSDYHRQAAIYMDAIPTAKEYYLIAIEKEAPYGISVHRMDQTMIDKGRDQYINLINEYRNWVDLGCPNSGYEYWHAFGIHEFAYASGR